MKKVGEQIKELDEQVKTTENNLREKLAELPNIPAEDVLPGGKENNKVIKVVGQNRS
jgi:seryl-tRNA synthetase